MTIKVSADISLIKFGSPLLELIRISRLVHQLAEEDEVIFDISSCRFSNPFLLAGISLAARSLEDRGVNVSFSELCHNAKFSSYKDSIKFPFGVNPLDILPSDFDNFVNYYANKNYIPIVSYQTANNNQTSSVREKFASVLNSVIVRSCSLKGGIRSAVNYLIDEAMQNTIDHSAAEKAVMFAQYYPSRGFLDLAIGDPGIGILGSYLKVPGKFPGVISHTDAMKMAVAGYSTKDIPESRGFGISTSINMLTKGLGGNYFLISGDSCYYAGRNVSWIQPMEGVDWKGTLYALRIPVNDGNFDYSRYIEER